MELTAYRSDEVPDDILMLLQRDYLILEAQLGTTNGVNEQLTQDELFTPLDDLSSDYISLASGYTSQVNDELLAFAYRESMQTEESNRQLLELLVDTKNAIGDALSLLDEFEERQQECECYLIVARDFESVVGFCVALQGAEIIVTNGPGKMAGIALISYLLPELGVWQDLPFAIEDALDDLGKATQSDIVIASDTIPYHSLDMMMKYHGYMKSSDINFRNPPCVSEESLDTGVIFRYV